MTLNHKAFILITGLVIINLLTGCSCALQTPDQVNNLSSDQVKSIIASDASKIIGYLKNGNFKALTPYVHPQKGLKFSPYPPVDSNDLAFTANQVESFPLNPTLKYKWGTNSEGEIIDTTLIDFFPKYMYDRDYQNSKDIFYNPGSNLLAGLTDLYPNSLLAEYFFYETKPGEDGWTTHALHLAFEKYQERWYLVAIIHE